MNQLHSKVKYRIQVSQRSAFSVVLVGLSLGWSCGGRAVGRFGWLASAVVVR